MHLKVLSHGISPPGADFNMRQPNVKQECQPLYHRAGRIL
ncbi:hypothetical protein L798_07104 [Zootermopsis nevadensis]|uniref:Uncharacterized protein n=1 Tax=Zootermopsis nevadensis TaxID=136037 RepID=A0A067RJN3_ZOONE|nr:hypothetical protein L798_07104 [Zootermopsis nevadensis]